MRLHGLWFVPLVLSTGCASPRQRAERHLHLAAEQIASFDIRKAERELNDAHEITPHPAETEAIQGANMLRVRQFDQAEALLAQAVKALPGNLAAKNNLAVVYLLTGRAREAADLLRPVVESGARQAAVLNNYALALRILGDFDRASNVFSQAVRINSRPTSPSGYLPAFLTATSTSLNA